METLIFMVVWLGPAWWVFNNAGKRQLGNSIWAWVGSALAFPIIAPLVYAIAAPHLKPASPKSSQPDAPTPEKTGPSKIVIFGGGFLALCFLAPIFIDPNAPADEDAPKETKAETREEMIKRQFSLWDGSHRGLTRYIKDSMNDPGSYEHVETYYGDKGDHLVVKTTFRGKNAFGGVVVNMIAARVDFDGNVIEIVAQSP